jgi:hypothetical protein
MLPQAPTVEETVAAYGEAWNEADEVKRAALLELSFAADGTYEDPQSRYEGRDALSEGIRDFLGRNPGARIEIASGVDRHHDKIRFRWRLLAADGSITSEGMDYGELAEDGRIKRIVGFFGPFPPE